MKIKSNISTILFSIFLSHCVLASLGYSQGFLYQYEEEQGDIEPAPSTDIDISSGQKEDISVIAGESFIFGFVVRNAFFDDSHVTLIDNFPTGLSCDWISFSTPGVTGNSANGVGNISEILNMPSNSLVSYVIHCNVSSSVTENSFNTATITSSIIDINPNNNSISWNILVTPRKSFPWIMFLPLFLK